MTTTGPLPEAAAPALDQACELWWARASAAAASRGARYRAAYREPVEVSPETRRAALELIAAPRRKAARAGASAIVRRPLALFRPDDAHAFGCFALQAWIAYDTEVPAVTPAIRARLEANARQIGWAFPTFEAAHRMVEADFLRGSMRSAIADKGVLAVAAAAGGPDVAPLVGEYLKTWYGWRAAQCKALLQMLSYVDHPGALQLLLATSQRFRTASIRKEAEKQVRALAARRRWTVDELADRTIATGGFDDEGTLRLEYRAAAPPGGPTRRFVARLGDDLAVALVSAEGEPLKRLPEARRDEDPKAAAAAKKALGAARKAVKTIARVQTRRLYEAMCAERAWRFDDWDTYLRRHPVVGRLCPRLVWSAREGDGPARSFRPLADGTLTDADDAPVTLSPGARVQIAHAVALSPDEVAAWRRHLADYEVAPLFEQLDRPPAPAGDGVIEAFEGHMVSAFRLRAVAKKRGYERGPAEEGGWFHAYRKPFPSLGLEAVVRFTGNRLPEEDRPVALLELSFAPTASAPVEPSGGLPCVLLAECFDDLRAMATAGDGFDPAWREKTSW